MEKAIRNSAPFMDKQSAAQYLGIDLKFLANQIRTGGGPVYVRPSPKIMLFRQGDLDTWRNTWEICEPAR